MTKGDVAALTRTIAEHFAEFRPLSGKPAAGWQPKLRAGAKRTTSGYYPSKVLNAWEIVHDGRTIGRFERKGQDYVVSDVQRHTLGTLKPDGLNGYDVFARGGSKIGTIDKKGFMYDPASGEHRTIKDLPDAAAWFFFSVMED